MPAHLRISQACQSYRDTDAFPGAQRFTDRRQARGLLPPSSIHPVEEESHRHLKALGDGVQAAGADAVGALLVFLDLLKGHAHSLAQRLLGNTPRYARGPHATAHVQVDGTGSAAVHDVGMPKECIILLNNVRLFNRMRR